MFLLIIIIYNSFSFFFFIWGHLGSYISILSMHGPFTWSNFYYSTDGFLGLLEYIYIYIYIYNIHMSTYQSLNSMSNDSCNNIWINLDISLEILIRSFCSIFFKKINKLWDVISYMLILYGRLSSFFFSNFK